MLVVFVVCRLIDILTKLCPSDVDWGRFLSSHPLVSSLFCTAASLMFQSHGSSLSEIVFSIDLYFTDA